MDAPGNEVKETGTDRSESVIAAEEVRDRLGDVIDRAFNGERFVVTRHAKERIAIIGARDYERFREFERAASASTAGAAAVGGAGRSGADRGHHGKKSRRHR